MLAGKKCVDLVDWRYKSSNPSLLCSSLTGGFTFSFNKTQAIINIIRRLQVAVQLLLEWAAAR